MFISQTGINLVKKFEGLHKVATDGSVHAYLCPAGVWTIGYGHTAGVKKGDKISQAQAERLLKDDLVASVNAVDKLVKVPLKQSQTDALASFVFNLGEGAFKGSTLLKKLNKGDYASVPAELMKWNKARNSSGKLVALAGLTRRRTAEAALFSFEEPLGDMEPLPQAPATSTKPLVKSKTMWGAALGLIGSVGQADEIHDLITTTANQIQPFTDMSHYVAYAFTGLTLIGAAIVIYSKLKRQSANAH